MTAQRKERNASIEFWRFAFAVLISLFHFSQRFSPNIIPSASDGVEFFFMLAGFFVAMSASKGQAIDVSLEEARKRGIDYVIKKLKAVYPTLIVCILLAVFAHPNGKPFMEKLKSLRYSEWELPRLVETPYGLNTSNGWSRHLWFMLPLLLCGYVYTILMARNKTAVMITAPIVGVLGYSLFVANATALYQQDVWIVLDGGMARGFAAMALGICVYGLYDYFSKKEISRFWLYALTALECYALYRFWELMFAQPIGPQNYRRYPYLMLIILFAGLNASYIEKLLNTRFSRWLGGLSMTMFLCHFRLSHVYGNYIDFFRRRGASVAYDSRGRCRACPQ
jgi:peptidoglycan/LPS O-acetylase OafA/YrhL